MLNANTPQAIKSSIRPKALSIGVVGEISPYPTVVIVVTAQ
jgi:hypothetical protein